ncbi:hypothetical protein VC83_02332 [Pseudogymnoascus destructans]|uniref:CENP-T/Histone H4 histone fold domain-containing protein n=2 Tax=Pseudogymnoascus destructans TaxID=655981 RepID=L8FQG4_PSED2|nr:uncharacterized protein VC83_02332 [Pseudogymnoascus destructans]ELR03210.1 hypothetical protein GMDG_01193 [Pseudogymnoascus destructans 20631-21]OAF61206.1 hypothetical protein VC83_02332 [Pseudogymnoascus destructans]
MSARRKSARKSGVGASAIHPPSTSESPILGAPQQSPAQVRQPRITPRNSLTEDGEAAKSKETPYTALRQLANIIPSPTTPIRRASSAGPPSTHRTARRTPGAQNITPGGYGPGSTRRPTAATPHGRAAAREIEMRRAAALTPGKDRRRSGLQKRETPRDLLRQLSKRLAPGTIPVAALPEMQKAEGPRLPFTRLNDVDDEPAPTRPRLSMAIGDDEDDSLLLPPHSDALLDDDNMTMRSVELPRRAVSEQPGGRLSRGSFGSIRYSDQFDRTMGDPERFDSSFIQGNFDDEGPFLQDDPSIMSERTGTLDLRGAFAAGRSSDVRGPFEDDEHEATFAFAVPRREDRAMSAQAANVGVPRRSIGPALEGTEVEEEEEVQLESEEAEEDNDLEGELELELEAEVEDEEDLDIDQVEPTVDMTMNDTVMADTQLSAQEVRKPKAKKTTRVSKHGIQYSSLPAGVVKKLATTFARTGGSGSGKISKDALAAIMQATDWFFEQVSDDLGAYAAHAGRKTIDENDVMALMKRQRQINAITTPFALAQKHLPRELLQDFRMVPPTKLRKGKKLKGTEEE